jgi:hypothetical protein
MHAIHEMQTAWAPRAITYIASGRIGKCDSTLKAVATLQYEFVVPIDINFAPLSFFLFTHMQPHSTVKAALHIKPEFS